MYLSKLTIENFRLFGKPITVEFHKGLNLLVGENGCGKSTVIDAIRMLLDESEFRYRGIYPEDFNTLNEKKCLSVQGVFSELSEEQKIEYLTWLSSDFNAILNFECIYRYNARNTLRQRRWGGLSSNSVFDWECLNDIQCVYLPALRDAEKSLKAGRGSRLSRLLTTLSWDKLMATRKKQGGKMELEQKIETFNNDIVEKDDAIKSANKLINKSIQDAVGIIFGQSTAIKFSQMSYERIVETLQLFFSSKIDDKNPNRSLYENSLGYNNLIYIATILAEFEGLKSKYTSPRILLIEELEAHLHPQLQMKLLRYLTSQAENEDIQVIITSHSTTLAAATPIQQIICFNEINQKIEVTSIKKCEIDKSSEQFIDRWLDATKSVLLFSKGNIFVEGIAEAILIPKLAELYQSQKKENNGISCLEDAGISVINMNGIYFHYFIQLYNGYRPVPPDSKNIKEFLKKEKFESNEYKVVSKIDIPCAVITDNDPVKREDGAEAKPTKSNPLDGSNPQLYLKKQLENMTTNCRVYTNLKTFEYDLAIESKRNTILMLEVLSKLIPTNGTRKQKVSQYLETLKDKINIDMNAEIALFILHEIETKDIGKGLFAQILSEKITTDNFDVPDYIKGAIDFVIRSEENL